MFCSLIAVILLILLPVIGVRGLGWNFFFGSVVPSAALALFVLGFIYRVLKWGRSPVPFHIPTVCGQQRSLSWIKASPIDSPSTTRSRSRRAACNRCNSLEDLACREGLYARLRH